MNSSTNQHKNPWTPWFLMITSALGAFFLYLLYRWREQSKIRNRQTIVPPDLTEYHGLSDEEAQSLRSPDIDLLLQERQNELRKNILRRNVVSIFNISLLGLAISQLILRDPLGALITFGTLILNVVVNVAQELISVRRVADMRLQVRPLASVIRSGQLKGVPVEDVVAGDVLLIQAGDEFPADGLLLNSNGIVIYDPSHPTGFTNPESNPTGQRIAAGSQCKEGWGVFRADEYPSPHTVDSSDGTGILGQAEDLTPLQSLIDRFLKLMLGAVVLFIVVLVVFVAINISPTGDALTEIVINTAEMVNMPPEAIASMTDYLDVFFNWLRNMVGLIFSLAPSGLFFMIVVAYAVGIADIGRFGAFVRRAQTVESLSQVTTLCLSKGAAMSGAEVQLDMIPLSDGRQAMQASHVTQILGSFARSQQNPDFIIRALIDNFDGEVHFPKQDFYYLNAFGWGAIVFDDIDLRGTYVIGLPQILEKQFDPEEVVETEDDRNSQGLIGRVTNTVQQAGNPFRRLFGKKSSEDEPDVAVPEKDDIAISHQGNGNDVEDQSAGDESQSGIRKTIGRLGGLFGRRDAHQNDQKSEDAPQVEPKVELVFAYSPELQPLFTDGGVPLLPEGLTPLCKLVFIEQMRPETRNVIRDYIDAGVQVKIFTSDSPARVHMLASQLGLDADRTVTGDELRNFDKENFTEQALMNSIFAELNAHQKSALIDALRASGEFLAYFGEDAEDELALRKAHVKISSLKAHWTVLQIADIVMIQNSIEAMSAVFQKGQRIVNGLMSILKLNLVQITYVLLLLVAFFATPPMPFLYHPTQGSVIVFFTVVLPNIGLTIWAPKGAAPRDKLGRRLARFILPAALLMSVVALLIFYWVVFYLNMSIIIARLAVTHGFIYMGLLLALFAQPPGKFWVGGNHLSGDRRITWMVLFLLSLWFLVITIPIAHELLMVDWLDPLWLHAPVAGGVAVWMLVVRWIWRSRWLGKIFDVNIMEPNGSEKTTQ